MTTSFTRIEAPDRTVCQLTGEVVEDVASLPTLHEADRIEAEQ